MSPCLSTKHIRVCWSKLGGQLGCSTTGNQSDPASTMVWLLQGEGLHPCPYSTVTASGQISLPF